MIIKDEHIREAENLLINGKMFDTNERIPFIKEFNSCDLLAVPGSGKTTVLLAKLYCISKHLPFEDGSGILVLSHTNAAVNEIEKNLKPHCPKLFEYPNFVGTIQSFVNKFLANQACYQKYGSYIRINDNDIYDVEANKFFNSLVWKKTEPKGLKNKLLGRLNIGKDSLSFDEKVENIRKFLKGFELNISERKITFNESTIYSYAGSSQLYYLELETWKESLLKKGILNYKDSFNLGEWYIDNYPKIKIILKNRFSLVFIDEMQDLEQFQIDVIDKIFFEGDSSTIIQRIGDINQAIYNSGKRVKVETDWVPRNQMYLNGSNRLTSENANIVNCFTLDRQKDDKGNPRFIVNGLRQVHEPIKPYLILFDNQSMGRLEEKFKELIKNYSLQNTREGLKYGFKIIGWNAKWADDEDYNNKLRLENIFQSYKKEAKTNKETFDSLSKYIQLFDNNKTTLEAARKAVLNSLIHILRLEEKTYKVKIRGNEFERHYSKNELFNYIVSQENNCDYEYFKKIIFRCSYKLAVKKDYKSVYDILKKFVLEEFKLWYNLPISSETEKFLGDDFERIIENEETESTNDRLDELINVEIDTVHSAKGQTHCATMYVETAYQRPTYESEKIIKDANPLLLQEHKCKGKYDRQALKMMYVGYSRPTHLLCFAALKENIGTDFQPYIDAGWNVVDITEE
jgi:DNA helicase II / ATP-dependent DNA helicase PcrA